MFAAGLVTAALSASSCAYVSLNMGKAVPLAEATRAKAIGHFQAEGACSIHNPLAGGVTFNPLSTDGTNLDKPSSMGCLARLAFTPDGEGLLVLAGGSLRRVDWRTGKTVWVRTPPQEIGFGWSTDRRWLVAAQPYGEAERACWRFFETEPAEFCSKEPMQRVRPLTIDPATGLVVTVDAVGMAPWKRDAYHFGVSDASMAGHAVRLVDLRTGEDVPVKAPGAFFATSDGVRKNLKPGEASRWMGPTDFDASLETSLWLRVAPDKSGKACTNAPEWALEVAAYRGGAPVWSRTLPCVSPNADVAAWYSPEGKYVGVPYSTNEGAPAFAVLDAATGAPALDMTRVDGAPYARFVAVPAGSPLAPRAGSLIGPVVSEAGHLARLRYDPMRGGSFRIVEVADIATGNVIATHDFGVDESSDGRYPTVAISRDGKRLALFDTTGAVTVLPSGVQ